MAALEAGYFADKVVFAGIVNGRNVWGTDLRDSQQLLAKIQEHVKEVVIQPSCSLLHVPVTTQNETGLEPVLREGLAFADEKLQELRILADQSGLVEPSPSFSQKVAALKLYKQQIFGMWF